MKLIAYTIAILAALLLGACQTSHKHAAPTAADDQAISIMFK
tara:strand:+ start:495 stop:620 length:126 start_codon:yes stop_codon:yes gene_type:complete